MSQKFKSEVELQALNNATTDTDKFLVSDSGVVKYRTGNEVLSDLGITLNTASKLQHQVKAGVAINKGQAVYVTSADGTNMIVGLASNASEATSSKTMGLLDATVVINGFANVVTEGLLAGLNTVGANAGDPVWLGTGGNLIYGLLNKPYAPAHLVFIGIVTRVNANNGEIFVKVQNGFELNEIHDIDLKTTTPINGHILGFDGTLWVNKTIAGWLGYTPANASGTTNYLPKFTSATTLGNSQIFDNGTNVGIGTTSPSYKLDIDGALRASSGILNSNSCFEKVLGTPYFTHGVSNLAVNINLGNLSFWGYIEVEVTGSYSNQNTTGKLTKLFAVGTNPGNLIYANESRVSDAFGPVADNMAIGEFYWDGSQYAIRLSHIESSGNDYTVKVKMFTYGDGAQNVFDAISIGSLYSYTALAKQYPYYNDRLGIGTTSPSSKLHVYSSGEISRLESSTTTMYQTFRANGTNVGYIGNGTGAISGGSATDFGIQITNNFVISTGGASEKMRITSSGNVGIGTTSPSAKLDVNGDVLINGLTVGRGGGSISSNTTIGINALSSNSSGQNIIAVGRDAVTNLTDVDGLTVIGVDANRKPDLTDLESNSIAINQFNPYFGYGQQVPHFYAPDKIYCPINFVTNLLTIDYSVYTAAFLEYSIYNSGGDRFRAGRFVAAFEGTGTPVYQDYPEAVYIGTTLAAKFTITSGGGNNVIVQLENYDSDDYIVRFTSRLLMR